MAYAPQALLVPCVERFGKEGRSKFIHKGEFVGWWTLVALASDKHILRNSRVRRDRSVKSVDTARHVEIVVL